MRPATALATVALALLACPPSGSHSTLTGVWATDGEPGLREGVVVYVLPTGDGGMSWSPLRLDLFDGGLILTHSCRDFGVRPTGEVSAATGIRPAGMVTERSGGFDLTWTLGEATGQLWRAALDARPIAADTFLLSASVNNGGAMTLRTEWRLDASVVLLETRELQVSRQDSCP